MNQHNQPQLSIIIPVYNAEKYLARCLDSVLNQTFKDFEVILVDDGAKDQSGALCDQLAAEDARIRVIHQKNAGVSVARNTGLNAAYGAYAAFVDADDWLEPDMYEKMLKQAAAHDCDVVMCDCVKEFPQQSAVYSHDIREGFYNKEQLVTEYFPHLIISENVEYPATISNWTILFRRSLTESAEQIRYIPGVRFSEDWLFGSQLLYRADSFYYMKGSTFYHYVMNPASASHSFAADKWNDYKVLYRASVDHFLKCPDFDFKDQLNQMLLFLTYNACGEAIRAESLSPAERKQKARAILNEPEVRAALKSIKISRLSVSWKQRLITYCYRYRFVSLLYLYNNVR